jgi:uncharacterized protein (DUF342 family)
MAERGKNYDLEVKSDGIYLKLVQPDDPPKVTRAEVAALIEEYGVADVDYVSLSAALKSDEKIQEVKISSNKVIFQVNESAAIEVSEDRMEAYIVFSQPVNKGRLLTKDEIFSLLRDHNITPSASMVEQAMDTKRYGRKILIAQGSEPTAGTDGFLQFHFDRSNLKPKPKIMEDGTVNFKQLGTFRMCNRGDVLVTSVPAREGQDGKDVYGNAVPAPKARPAANIPRGKGTVLSPDGLHLLADVSGQLLLLDGKINISPHMTLEKVDNSTGDIDFNGQVTIRGNVSSGFTVRAAGNIEVFGVCEAAKLVSENGSIVLGNGVQGSDKGVLEAAQDITAKFIESCKVSAGGNITADSIRTSHIKCDGSVIVAGKNGALVGGTCVAGDKVVARTIGSPMGTSTEIEVGGNPKEVTKQKDLTSELDKLKVDYDKCEKAVETLTKLKEKNQLPDDKKAMLVKMINMKMVYRDKMTKMQEEIDKITRTMAVSTGTVSASNLIRPGVKITIGNAQLIVRDELSNCRLRNNGEKIQIGPNL